MSPRAKEKLRSLDVRPSKERGQNFLIDDSVIQSIVGFGAPKAEENLVEIGPGLGALTRELAKFPKLSLIEIEEKFCAELAAEFPKVKIVNRDVREVPFSDIGSDLVVFGNLPYVFSTEIVMHLVANAQVITRAVLLLQREFAERLASPPGGREYGRLSIATQLWADLELGPIIPGTSFHPPTSVQSRLVSLKFLKKPRVEIRDQVWFEKVVKAAFSKRRKKLSNSLFASGYLAKERIDAALTQAGIDPGRRAETLSISEFVALAEALYLPPVK